MTFLTTLSTVTLGGLAFMASNASAATVTYTLDLSVNNVFRIYAEASAGDNGGIAGYSIPLTGTILSLDHRSPAAVIATNGAPAGFTTLRSSDLPAPSGSPTIAGTQQLDTPNRIYSFGQAPGSFAADGMPVQSLIDLSSDEAWTAPALIAMGVYDREAGTLDFRIGSANLTADVFTNAGGTTRVPAVVMVRIIPYPVECPNIEQQPASQTACIGGSATFTVTVSGLPPLNYQWRRGTTSLSNGGNISGATSPSLTIGPLTFADRASNYNCIISNACDSVTSTAAALTVNGCTCADWRRGPFSDSQADNGTDGPVYALIPWEPDDQRPGFAQLVVGGLFDTIEGTPVRNLAVRDPLSGQWRSLGNPAVSPFDSAVRGLTVFNRQLIAGYGAEQFGNPRGGAALWNGSAWEMMGVEECIPEYVNMSPYSALCFGQIDGRLLAGGSFTAWWNDPSDCLGQGGAALTSWDGSSHWFANFGSEFWVYGFFTYAMASYNGQVIVGGEFCRNSGNNCSFVSSNNPGNKIAAWDGSTWSDMRGGANHNVRAMTVYNGELIAGGQFSAIGGQSANFVGRWNGSTWRTLGSGVTAEVRALTVYHHELIAGGRFVSAGGQPASHIARWNSATGSWQPLGSGIDGDVYALTVVNDELIAGGDFTTAGELPANNIARWDGVRWSAYGGGTVGSVTAYAQFGSPALPRLIAAGDFHQQTSVAQQAHSIVSWDGVALRPLGTGMNSSVTALAGFTNAEGDYELVAGGPFTTAGGVGVNYIARWREDPIAAFPSAWAPMGNGFNNPVAALARFNGRTVAGGSFTASGATTTICIARWNESTDVWEPYNGGTNGPVFALKGYSLPHSFDVQLVAGGIFTTAGSTSRVVNHITSLTENTQNPTHSSWSAMGPGFNGNVYAIERHAGSTYAGGEFTASGATSLRRIARFTGTAWVDVGGGFNNTVWALRSSGSNLYAAGDFITNGAQTVRRIARWDGTTWEEVSGGTGGHIQALGLYHDEIHAGGSFLNVRNGLIHSPGWARYTETGIPWIARQPASKTLVCGQNYAPNMQVAVGYDDLSFEWRKDGVPLADGPTGTGSTIAGATGDILVGNVGDADAGVYDCIVSNSCGSVTSSPATLAVTGCPPVGDMNCDRVIDFLDVDPFTLALTDSPAYHEHLPNCLIESGDVNGDGVLNGLDVGPFAECVINGGCQ